MLVTRGLRERADRYGDRLLAPCDEVQAQAHWRSLGCKWLAGGLLTLLTLFAGPGEGFDVRTIALINTVSIVVGALALLASPRLPASWLPTTMVVAIVVVSGGVVASGTAHTPYVLFYAWVGAEAWYVLSQRAASVVTLGAVLVSAGAMTIAGRGEADTLAWTLMVIGTLLAVGALAAVLRLRSERLIGQLRRAAVCDELTGLLNRRGYQQRLQDELARARRYETPLSIVLGDIDEFKILNDSFGHRCGDDALRAFADVCSRQLRDVDFASRVGGEEFAVVLPQTDEQGAFLAAERLRRAVSAELSLPDGSTVSASFGVATFPRHGTDPEVLLDHADRAMYAAKAMGRDRTVGYTDDLQRSEPLSPQVSENLEAVVLLAETLDLRDAATRAHSDTVARLCAQTARTLGLPCDRVERIRLAGLLHDVGKIGVPDEILRKPGKLTPAEWDEMRKHPEVGARIVAAARLDDVAQWVLAHHERPDGRGYPFASSGDRIPLEARILAVADAYEAMTADRPYRKAPGPAHALAELLRGSGTQFDPEIVAAFVSALPGEGEREGETTAAARAQAA